MFEEIQEFDASSRQRGMVAGFLARHFASQGRGDAEAWLRRMAHWWDANPAARDHPARGWFIGDRHRVRAFAGVIPFRYRVGDKPVLALSGTSWAMDEAVRSSVIPMAMKLQRLGDEAVLVATTPSPEVRSMLRKGGWSELENHQRLILPGFPGLRRLFLRGNPAGSGSLRLTFEVDEVKSIAPQKVRAGVLWRDTTPEFLRWYLASPARRHHFAGLVDGDGRLSAHVIVAPAAVRKMAAWEVVDISSGSADGEGSVTGLVEALLATLPRRPWLILNRLGTEWRGVRPLKVGRPKPTLFHRSPVNLAVKEKRWQMAEGDLGL